MNNNDKYQLPISYSFPKFLKGFTLFIGVTIVIYCIYVLFNHITPETRRVISVLYWITLVFGVNAIMTNILALHKISLTDTFIKFHYLAKKNVIISWDHICKIETVLGKRKYFILHYFDNDSLKMHQFSMAFTGIVDIIKIIYQKAPHIETDDFVGSLLFISKDK